MDNKHYIILDGSMACPKAEMDADGQRLALQTDGTPFPHFTECKVFTEGSYTAGIDTVVCIKGHWYDY